jgi:hypothetical protein
LGDLNSSILCLLSSITDLAHKLQDAKNESEGTPFTSYFTGLLSSVTRELKKQLSDGFHRFLSTGEPPAGVFPSVFSLYFLHFSSNYVEPLEGTCFLDHDVASFIPS